MVSKTIQIEIAYALVDEQFLWVENVVEGTTVKEALGGSTLLVEFPNVNMDNVGVFGKLVTQETILRAGDRIEVYRPLKVDPRNRRRKEVEEARSAAK